MLCNSAQPGISTRYTSSPRPLVLESPSTSPDPVVSPRHCTYRSGCPQSPMHCSGSHVHSCPTLFPISGAYPRKPVAGTTTWILVHIPSCAIAAAFSVAMLAEKPRLMLAIVANSHGWRGLALQFFHDYLAGSLRPRGCDIAVLLIKLSILRRPTSLTLGSVLRTIGRSDGFS